MNKATPVCRLVLLASVVLFPSVPLSAAPITWGFAGTMLNGDPFSGFFTFESTTPDNIASTPLRGDYSNAGIDWQLTVGGVLITPIQTQGWSGNFEIFDDIQTNDLRPILGDHFRIYADAAPTIYRSAVVAKFDMFFEDASGALVTSDTLPVNPPDLSLARYRPGGWADYFGLPTSGAAFRLVGVYGDPIAYGEIASVTAVPVSQVPLPGTLGLMAAGFASLALVRRRTRA